MFGIIVHVSITKSIKAYCVRICSLNDVVTRFLPKAPIIAKFGGNTTFTTFDNRVSSLNTLSDVEFLATKLTVFLDIV